MLIPTLLNILFFTDAPQYPHVCWFDRNKHDLQIYCWINPFSISAFWLHIPRNVTLGCIHIPFL